VGRQRRFAPTQLFRKDNQNERRSANCSCRGVNPVEREVVAFPAMPAEPHAPLIGCSRVDRAGNQWQHRRPVAPVERQIVDLRPFHPSADAGRGLIDLLAVTERSSARDASFMVTSMVCVCPTARRMSESRASPIPSGAVKACRQAPNRTERAQTPVAVQTRKRKRKFLSMVVRFCIIASNCQRIMTTCKAHAAQPITARTPGAFQLLFIRRSTFIRV